MSFAQYILEDSDISVNLILQKLRLGFWPNQEEIGLINLYLNSRWEPVKKHIRHSLTCTPKSNGYQIYPHGKAAFKQFQTRIRNQAPRSRLQSRQLDHDDNDSVWDD